MKTKMTGWILTAAVVVTLAGCSKQPAKDDQAAPVQIKVGHVGHDHHLALYVALDNAAGYEKETGIGVRVSEDRKRYELLQEGKKIADVEVIVVGGGAQMPTALAQGVIDIGFGSAAASLASNDTGAPVKIIAPLHSRGDMLVAKPDVPAASWPEFVAWVKAADKPVRIGYKSPMANAKLILEEALTHEGIAFSGDLSKSDVKVHLVNTKGDAKLNVSLGGDLIDAYTGNNPYCAVAVEKGIGKIVCDLEDLPPGKFRNHPCCCIAANTDSIAGKGEAVAALLALFMKANETINSDLDKAVAAATRWIGTSEAVERMSIPTSGYSLEANEAWHAGMNHWIDSLNRLDVFTGKLKGLSHEEVGRNAYDLALLEKAKTRLD